MPRQANVIRPVLDASQLGRHPAGRRQWQATSRSRIKSTRKVRIETAALSAFGRMRRRPRLGAGPRSIGARISFVHYGLRPPNCGPSRKALCPSGMATDRRTTAHLNLMNPRASIPVPAPSLARAPARRFRLLALGPQEAWPATDGGKEGIHGALQALACRADVIYACPGQPADDAAEAHYGGLAWTTVRWLHPQRDSRPLSWRPACS